MESRKGSLYKVKWFWNILKNGLFLLGLRNRLANIGLDILPYYWVGEGNTSKVPTIRGDHKLFAFCRLLEADLKQLTGKVLNFDDSKPIKRIRKGDLCFGLKFQDEIAAYMFVQLDNLVYRNKFFEIKPYEAYLTDMYTFESFRGIGLAPYLRFKVYEQLKNQGFSNFYSISISLNKSTLRFKRKLKAENLKLILSAKVGKRILGNWIIWKKYGKEKAYSLEKQL